MNLNILILEGDFGIHLGEVFGTIWLHPLDFLESLEGDQIERKKASLKRSQKGK